MARQGETLAACLASYPDVTRGHVELLHELAAPPGPAAAAAAASAAAGNGGPDPDPTDDLLRTVDDATGAAASTVVVSRVEDGRIVGNLREPFDLDEVVNRWGPGRYRLVASSRGGAKRWARTVDLGRFDPLDAPQASVPPLESSPAPAPPSLGSGDALAAGIGLLANMLQAVVQGQTQLVQAVIESGTSRTPNVLELFQALNSRGPDAGAMLDRHVQAIQEGIKLGARVSSSGGDGSVSSAVAAVSDTIRALVEQRAMLRPPVTLPTGVGGVVSSAGAAAPPAPRARAAAPGPGWDELREVCAAINYGIENGDDPRAVAGLAERKLSPEILARLKVERLEVGVQWLLAQGKAIPAVATPAAREWLTAFVVALKGGDGSAVVSDDDLEVVVEEDTAAPVVDE